jgi:hypothetical protein
MTTGSGREGADGGQASPPPLDAHLNERLEGLVARPEPGVDRPRDQLVWQFAQQARASLIMGSPLYAHLLLGAIEDLETEGVTWRLVRDHVAPGRGHAIALRLLAAVHRLVLTGRAPSLERFFASTGGNDDVSLAWPVVLDVMTSQEATLLPLVALSCQTNEPGRSAALAIGLLDVAARFPGPIELIEIGCAAGLNLRWDQFLFGGGGEEWGDRSSPVDLRGFWVDVAPVPDVPVHIVRRTGIDPTPIDPTTEEGRLAVTSSVWGDQTQRFRLLAGAIELAARIPVTMIAADGVDWVEENLQVTPGHTTVLMQSVVREYLDDAQERRLEAAVAAAGANASVDAPLAWVELEPITLTRRHGLRVTTWPGGEQRDLATAGSLGMDVRRERP